MLRDILLNLPISFLHVGTLYAVAAGTGAGALILLVKFDTPIPIAGLVCVVVTTLVRLAAVLFGWTFPEQRAVRPRRPKAPSPPGTRHLKRHPVSISGRVESIAEEPRGC